MDENKKRCADCQATLPLSDFYQIRGSDENRVRWEKVCKRCKRKRRKASKERVERAEGSSQSLLASPGAPKTPDAHSETAPQGASEVAQLRADGQTIYKEYIQPNGEILQLTKEEFDRVVEAFRMLWAQNQKKNKPPAA